MLSFVVTPWCSASVTRTDLGVRLVQSLVGVLALQSQILRLSLWHTCFRRREAVCLVKGFLCLSLVFIFAMTAPSPFAR